MSFEKEQPTSEQFITQPERDALAAARAQGDFSDIVADGESADSTEVEYQSEAPQLNIPAKDVPESSESLAEKLREKEEELKRQQEAQDQLDLQRLRDDEEVQENVHKFLLEACGAEPFSMTYDHLGAIKFTYSSVSSKERELVTRQNIRDIAVGRQQYQNEMMLNERLYRQALCLKSLVIVDPQTQKNILAYEREEAVAEVTAWSGEQLKQYSLYETDTLPARLLAKLQTDVVRFQRQQEVLNDHFQKFEHLQLAIGRFLELDPDFFTRESTTDSPRSMAEVSSNPG